MEHQLMSEEQRRMNNAEFNVIIANVRRINSGLADMLMTNRRMVDRHINALEGKCKLSLVKEG